MVKYIVSKRKVISTIAFALLLICLFCYYPYVFEKFLSIPNRYLIYIGSLAALLILCLWYGKLKPLPKTFNICFCIQILFFILYAIIHSDTAYFAWIVCAVLSFAFLLLCSNSSGLSGIVKVNNVVITVQVIMSFLAFFLILMGILGPLFTFNNSDGREAFCFGLTCSNAVFGNFVRVSGFFDEPGSLAFWGMYALILNKVMNENKKIEISLIIGLFATFSMAYFIQLFFYVLLYYCKKPKVIIPCIVIFLSALIIVPAIDKDDDNILYNLTIKRFQRGSNGKIETNRDELSRKSRTYFIQKPLFGHGETAMNEASALDNPYEPLAKDGIIGTLILYLPLCLALFNKRRDRKFVYGLLILFLGYLQRPLHAHLIHLFNLYLLTLLSYVPGRPKIESDCNNCVV